MILYLCILRKEYHSVSCCSVTQSCQTVTPRTAACLASLSFTVSSSRLTLMSIDQWSHPTILSSVAPFFSCPQSFPASGSFPVNQFFASSGQIYWSFSISPSSEYSGLVSFRFDWFDLLAVQGTLSLLQQHSSKTSVSWHSAFFMGQRSHSYLIAGNTIAFTTWTFVSKVIALLLNVLSSFVSFSSKEQASFNFMAAVTIRSYFGAKEKKVSHCFYCFPIYLPWNDRTRCHDLSFLNVGF